MSILRVCYLDANIRCVFCISALRILYSWVVLLGILLGSARRSFSLLGDYGAQAFLKPCLIVLSKMQSPDCKQKAPQNTPSPPYFQHQSYYFFINTQRAALLSLRSSRTAFCSLQIIILSLHSPILALHSANILLQNINSGLRSGILGLQNSLLALLHIKIRVQDPMP